MGQRWQAAWRAARGLLTDADLPFSCLWHLWFRDNFSSKERKS